MDGLVQKAREELGIELEVDPTPVLLAPYTYGPEGVWVLAIGFEGRIVGRAAPGRRRGGDTLDLVGRGGRGGLCLGARQGDGPPDVAGNEIGGAAWRR